MAFIVIDDRIKGRIVMMGLIGQLQEEDMNMKNEFLCMIGWGGRVPAHDRLGSRVPAHERLGARQCYVTQWEEESLHRIGWSKWPVIECLMIS